VETEAALAVVAPMIGVTTAAPVTPAAMAMREVVVRRLRRWRPVPDSM
jgi:hypothetical protein